ncbi:MAG: GNAT family N-acetyltransferase [Micromonosporaceae bacterium]
MPPRLTVRPGRGDEIDALAQIIAEAFAPIPPSVWLIRDADTRAEVFRPYFGMFVEHALKAGHVDVVASARTDRPVAVAVWWDGHDPGPHDYATRLAQIVPPHELERFVMFDAKMHNAHPDGPAHFDYLAFLAVNPKLQRSGLGSMLLRHRHQHLDDHGQPAFLQAASAEARDLYHLRHGYSDHGPPITLPKGPPVWPMWRDPQGRST